MTEAEKKEFGENLERLASEYCAPILVKTQVLYETGTVSYLRIIQTGDYIMNRGVREAPKVYGVDGQTTSVLNTMACLEQTIDYLVANEYNDNLTILVENMAVVNYIGSPIYDVSSIKYINVATYRLKEKLSSHPNIKVDWYSPRDDVEMSEFASKFEVYF
ncbi:hypothetical protein [Enterococcus sp. AD013-P3]|uniref:hypothetical protein n=1 Tax=Enterococcus sp. AD013-P3 TaxID=3411036 RepID=UPI003B94038B